MLLVGGRKVSGEYITAAEAARFFGLNPDYAARLAKRAADRGQRWPVKKRGTWLAPISAWEKIFHPEQMKIRKKRSVRNKSTGEITPSSLKSRFQSAKTDGSLTTRPTSRAETNGPGDSNLLTAKDFSKKTSFSHSWVAELGRRAKECGYSWPKKIGNMMMAPENEWKIIVLSTKFKKRNNQKRNKNVNKLP
jgi:hypothetical protein